MKYLFSAYCVDDSVSPIEIGSYVQGLGLSANLELMEVLPDLTNEINSLDVTDLLSVPMTANNVRHTLAGLCTVINRLLLDNRFLMRELASVKSGTFPNLSRLERYEFRKRLIRSIYVYPGGEGIPSVNLNEIVNKFDQTTIRRGENALATIRRFVRFLLEAVSFRLYLKVNSFFRLSPQNSIRSLLFVNVEDRII